MKSPQSPSRSKQRTTPNPSKLRTNRNRSKSRPIQNRSPSPTLPNRSLQRSVDAPQAAAPSQHAEASPRIERPQTAPRIAAHFDSPVATDSTSAVKLFQTAHGRMVMLQRLDAQLSVVLEQRQKLQSELAALQDEINNEFDRVARSAEDTLATIMT